MSGRTICPMCDGAATEYAVQALTQNGLKLSNQASQAQYLLYSVPTPAFLREEIPLDRVIIGGNLDFLPTGVQRIDLMKDEAYVAANAALTAEAAVGLITRSCESAFSQTKVLILGWGRIGKCLARLLERLDFQVCVCARRKSEQALAAALGYESRTPALLNDYDYIVNTVPGGVFSDPVWKSAQEGAVKLELASQPGIPGKNVIQARGLPGKYKAKASGALIAASVLRLLGGEDG